MNSNGWLQFDKRSLDGRFVRGAPAITMDEPALADFHIQLLEEEQK
ncbi:MAG: hypothetical protein HYZ15_00180 [Sphingobacteriales bacterium]|nr:hypothetical protein [Sphingobacteriales bacterium]